MKLTKAFKMVAAAAVIALMCLALPGCAQGGSPASGSASASQAGADSKYGSGTHHVEMTVEGYDPVVMQLDADEAPITVANFCELADDGFYDGLNFYRFVDGFCMQGGSSNNSAAIVDDGLDSIVGEFSANGVSNALADRFDKGTVAMARSSDPDSATSTFFITLGEHAAVGASLDGKYAAFGTIDADGMQVIDQIVADYLPNVTDAQMGAISDESRQAKISSMKVLD